MPPRLPKACRERGCSGKSTEAHGYCDKHKSLASWGKHQQQRGENPYNSAKWKRVRHAIMKRDKGLCQECMRNGRVRVGTDCDHIIPLARGGDMYRYSNLEMLCKQCHKAKTGRESR